MYALVKNGQVIQWPLIATDERAKTIKGAYPAVVNKPDTFRDEKEAWKAPAFEIVDDIVVVTLTKRPKTQGELAAQDTERQAMKDREADNIEGIVAHVERAALHRKFSTEQRSRIIKAVK